MAARWISTLAGGRVLFSVVPWRFVRLRVLLMKMRRRRLPEDGIRFSPPCPLLPDAKIVPVAPMSDRSGQRQCRRGVSGDVELDAAMALANMAGVSGPAALPAVHPAAPQHGGSREEEEEELASTRLSLELGKVGIQASCSSSSSAGCPSQQARVAVAAPGGGGYGPRPRHTLTEAEKEAKRLRRVLANRESARQTILRRQAIRDELARKVADLSSQNESMKKVIAKTAEKAPPPVPLHETTSGGASQGTGGGTAEEDTDDDPCSLTLGLDVDRKCATSAESGGSRAVAGERERAVMAAEARKRRKELTKMKQTHLGGRPGDE
ncbi:G-box-binding factor 1-like [Triticum dicoccoides]|uniref:G-box-binding factor 1-like n=1 Tax=Triticum dicoccoides TaxID=85692 RepID=UPI00188ED3B6|nr:G-box-binding factor 1-like [Triticum dicoccoides]